MNEKDAKDIWVFSKTPTSWTVKNMSDEFKEKLNQLNEDLAMARASLAIAKAMTSSREVTK